MPSSVGSCSPAIPQDSPEYTWAGTDYDMYVQWMTGADPYALGYAPLAPDSSPAVDSFLSIPDGPDV